MLSAMAQAAGVAYVETLTGFKWIARGRGASRARLVFGYEEALGYQVADAVADKDGLSAALVAAEIAATARRGDVGLSSGWTTSPSRFGVHATRSGPSARRPRRSRRDGRDRRAACEATHPRP